MPKSILDLINETPLGLLNKSKSLNRRGRKRKTQSSQRAEKLSYTIKKIQ